jgi:hypothetical protein
MILKENNFLNKSSDQKDDLNEMNNNSNSDNLNIKEDDISRMEVEKEIEKKDPTPVTRPLRNKKTSRDNNFIYYKDTSKRSLQEPKRREEFVVDKIINKKVEEDGTYYLVRWEGYPKSYDLWLHQSKLNNSKDAIDDYESMRGEDGCGTSLPFSNVEGM